MNKIRGLILTMLAGVAFCAQAQAQPPAPPASAPAFAAPMAILPPPAPPAPPGAVPPPPVPPAAVPPPPVPPAAVPAPPSPPAAASMAQPAAPPVPPAPFDQAKPPRPPKPGKAPEAAPPEAPQPPEAARPPEPPGRERPETDPVNIRFEVTVSSQTGTGAPTKRSALVTVSNGANPGSAGMGMLRSGNSIPVATTSLATKGEDGKETPSARPLTSYNYRSVGLNVDINNAVVLPRNMVRAMLNIEFSGVDDKASAGTGAPSFPTFSQRMSLYLESGKPVMVAQSSDFVDNVERKQTVEVKATVLR